MQRLETRGAPILLLPRRVLAEWSGILSREARSDDAMVDFVDEQGAEWFIRDEGDPANPVTDYDRLCAAFRGGGTERLVTIGGATALAIDDGRDTATWWQAQRAVVTGADTPSVEGSWEPLFDLEAVDDAWVLMNASVAGVQVVGDDDDDKASTCGCRAAAIASSARTAQPARRIASSPARRHRPPTSRGTVRARTASTIRRAPPLLFGEALPLLAKARFVTLEVLLGPDAVGPACRPLLALIHERTTDAGPDAIRKPSKQRHDRPPENN